MKSIKLMFPLVLAFSLAGSVAGVSIAQAQSTSVTPPPVVAPPVTPPPAMPPATTPPAATPDASATTPPAPPAAATATPPDASAAAVTPVAPPVTPDAATVNVANPYGLGALWDSGDMVARATLLILVVMSMGSWYVLITKGFAQSKMLRESRQVDGDYWKTNSVRQAAATLKPGSAYQFIAQSGVKSLEDHTGLLDKIDIHSFAESSVQDGVDIVQSKMQEGLALLGTVGSTAPFVGLFGTVWGIYHALTAIGIAGQASIDKVAGPVGESLIMTAIGLAVAVPAVLGYNFLVRRNKRVMDMTRRFAKKVLFVLLSNDASPSKA